MEIYKILFLLFLATRLQLSSEFSTVEFQDERFKSYLLANKSMMSNGAKIIKLQNGTYAIISVASVVLDDQLPTTLLEAETVTRIKALREIVGFTKGVQISSVQKNQDQLEIKNEGKGTEAKSLSAYLEITESKVQGITKGMAKVAQWQSKDRKVFYMAMGSFCDKSGNPIYKDK